ncbi:hypothetical protein BIFGAL_02823 [Bifidobacterium gallicum DSM 20093 = LMG 11596]|uniref:Uncharacterized protein n=1 Tax=Bifidobacterium gallicum DSM 20093 = LMG 11596 TaxID=561180 RepID=D1NSR3_9BIFI|nr:hypothetical protein BIFGAL_02823 [Bifidobacterium gallicum DSM 20093 = LMG 11596]KFI59262.1 hypothetical protein BGLCM_0855 [Bifidobacterium gallicum DSM 20093 = LMG 11596]
MEAASMMFVFIRCAVLSYARVLRDISEISEEQLIFCLVVTIGSYMVNTHTQVHIMRLFIIQSCVFAPSDLTNMPFPHCHILRIVVVRALSAAIAVACGTTHIASQEEDERSE